MVNTVTVTIVQEDGNPALPHVQGTWSRFMGGHWTKEVPDVPGRYLTADDRGKLNGEVMVYREKDGSVTKRYRSTAVDTLQDVPDCWVWSEGFPVVHTEQLPMRDIVTKMMLDREARKSESSKPSITLVPTER